MTQPFSLPPVGAEAVTCADMELMLALDAVYELARYLDTTRSMMGDVIGAFEAMGVAERFPAIAPSLDDVMANLRGMREQLAMDSALVSLQHSVLRKSAQ